jgi:hypothetical protein
LPRTARRSASEVYAPAIVPQLGPDDRSSPEGNRPFRGLRGGRGSGCKGVQPAVPPLQRNGSAGPNGGVRNRAGAGGRALAPLGIGAGDRGPSRVHPRALCRPGTGGLPGRVYRPRDEHPDARLRLRPGSLPGGPGQGRRGHHPGDRPVRDRLYRSAPGGVRRGDARGRPQGRLEPPPLHPGRPLSGQRQEVPVRP